MNPIPLMKNKASSPGIFIILLFFTIINGCKEASPDISIEGALKKWHPITLKIQGPQTGEDEGQNPFLHYRLNVQFTNGEDSMVVPGFFAADGNASESAAQNGNIWKVKFTPFKEGLWTYTVSFRQGENIAVNESIEGDPLPSDGLTGEFRVDDADSSAPGFYGKGRLQYTGERYLRFAESGDYFIKGGADSPENFLAYGEFDNTPPKHFYEPHIKDWNEGDPLWHGSKGKGIIGALNYLASEEMNVVYFLTMNVLGDGEDVFPWTSRDERYRFDCSKLDQWNLIFDHFDKLGILMHVVTQENENQVLLDAGFTDVQRKLYYRELVARFSHHLGVVWNMGEENGPANWYHNLGQSIEQRQTMAEHLRSIDPYKNLLVFHTMPSDPERTDYMVPMLGKPYVDGISLQVSNKGNIHEVVKKWVDLSADSGRQWVVNMDEIGPHFIGLVPDSEDASHDTIRTQALWGAYMAGAAGTEWYMGPEDLSVEDFRSRQNMWTQTRIAMKFFTDHIPADEMISMDELITSGDAWCFAKEGEVYALYLFQGGEISLDLRRMEGSADLSWINPREEREVLVRQPVEGGSVIKVGPPPSEPDRDWVVLIENKN
jgi:hypothetical protein